MFPPPPFRSLIFSLGLLCKGIGQQEILSRLLAILERCTQLNNLPAIGTWENKSNRLWSLKNTSGADTSTFPISSVGERENGVLRLGRARGRPASTGDWLRAPPPRRGGPEEIEGGRRAAFPRWTAWRSWMWSRRSRWVSGEPHSGE